MIKLDGVNCQLLMAFLPTVGYRAASITCSASRYVAYVQICWRFCRIVITVGWLLRLAIGNAAAHEPDCFIEGLAL